jgi:hypothetical protein
MAATALAPFPLESRLHSRGNEGVNEVELSFIPPYSIIAVELLPVVLKDMESEVPLFTFEL